MRSGGIEVWAGVECSYNRVGDVYFDQLERGRMYTRVDVLDQLAALGVTAIRFPVIWERYAALGEKAWEWSDAGLDRLRDFGITPIVGLMHHGSGPPGFNLLDERFASGLAAFARTVAERYPWVDRYTPINEPLTTARFATLYGLWYPHERSPRAFARAVVAQCRAIRDAMDAVRQVNPGARLVQTEDLGKTYASAELEYQAEFENERRWLTFDLLCGRVVGNHPLARYLQWAGVTERELRTIAERACPPDVIGINHYLTSERFLDHQRHLYPPESWGGNGRHEYADVEAVRVLGDGIAGPYALLNEAWSRYERPIAVTEVQLACTREQQLRWLYEVWQGVSRLRREGADVRAITAWSAFGAYDWGSLLTRSDGHYEPGVFDLRGPEPRKTALAAMVRSLVACGDFDHPVLDAPGWWRCDSRLTYAPVMVRGRVVTRDRPSVPSGEPRRFARYVERPLAVVGAHGTLGRAVARACEQRGLPHVAFSRGELDISDERAIDTAITAARPWALVNCAGFVRVDDAECARAACQTANRDGAAALARVCATLGVKMITFSSDLVFDGAKGAPYVESDVPRPLCEYGRTKAEAEALVLAAACDALVVRTAAFFGDHDDSNFVTRSLRVLAAGDEVFVASDVVVSPTYVPDLVNAALDLAIDNEHGVWHLANLGALTWEALARRAARDAGVSTASLRAVAIADLGLGAPRPKYSALVSERGSIMAPLEDALSRYARARPWERVWST